MTESHIDRLLAGGPKHPGAWNMVFNTMIDQANECPYQIVFHGPWGFEPHIGAHELREARGTAKAFVRKHPETENYEIWSEQGRIETCDMQPPSDDDRALEALGWPNASAVT